jgi:hypothetical protein
VNHDGEYRYAPAPAPGPAPSTRTASSSPATASCAPTSSTAPRPNAGTPAATAHQPAGSPSTGGSAANNPREPGNHQPRPTRRLDHKNGDHHAQTRQQVAPSSWQTTGPFLLASDSSCLLRARLGCPLSCRAAVGPALQPDRSQQPCPLERGNPRSSPSKRAELQVGHWPEPGGRYWRWLGTDAGVSPFEGLGIDHNRQVGTGWRVTSRRDAA